MKQRRWMMRLAAVVTALVLIGCSASKGELVSITNDQQYKEIQKEDVAYLYFGRDTCPDCRQFQPMLDKAIAETKQKVYYYDTIARGQDANFNEVLDTFGVVWLPTLLKLEKGEIKGSVNEKNTQEEVNALLK